MAVVIVGTLDTKGVEIGFVRDLLRQAGVETLVVDAGVGQPAFAADVPSEEVYKAASVILMGIREAADRGKAITYAAAGAARVIEKLHAQGRVQGVLGLGGSAGTTIGTAAMRVLPYGIPKLMVSTLASGQVQPYVGVRDILMLNSVTDICGLNRFTRQILANAAAAMAGMVRGATPQTAKEDRRLITATMFGVTTPCVNAARQQMESNGYEVLVFHATGTGGRTMETMIADGLIAGVLDITTTELADELVGGVLTAGRDRLTAAAIRGVPQVISLGALDMVNFGPIDSVPDKFRDRRLYQHNPTVTLMRTTPEENDKLGKEIAEKASAARGPTAILMPLKGVSAIDKEGGPFWWPEADKALFQSIRNWVGSSVRVIELDMHINDPAFAKQAADEMLAMIAKPRT